MLGNELRFLSLPSKYLAMSTFLKCGAGEGRRRSVGPIVLEMRKYCIESRREGMPYVQ